MFQTGSISVAGMIILILVLFVLIHKYEDKGTNRPVLADLDYNKDGLVSRGELRHYLSLSMKEKERSTLKASEIKRQAVSGVTRGFLMGFILGDLEGGIALGLVLGALNPVMYAGQSLGG
jgi:hypothetical protein